MLEGGFGIRSIFFVRLRAMIRLDLFCNCDGKNLWKEEMTLLFHSNFSALSGTELHRLRK